MRGRRLAWESRVSSRLTASARSWSRVSADKRFKGADPAASSGAVPAKGRFLKLEITGAISSGNAFIGHHKQVTTAAHLFQERERPFVLTSISLRGNFLAGEFAERVEDAASPAERIYESQRTSGC